MWLVKWLFICVSLFSCVWLVVLVFYFISIMKNGISGVVNIRINVII